MTVPIPLVSGLVGSVLLASLVLTAFAFLAYRRSGRGRFLFVASAFFAFFVRNLALTAGLFLGYSWATLFAITAGADAVLLLLLYLAVVR